MTTVLELQSQWTRPEWDSMQMENALVRGAITGDYPILFEEPQKTFDITIEGELLSRVFRACSKINDYMPVRISKEGIEIRIMDASANGMARFWIPRADCQKFVFSDDTSLDLVVNVRDLVKQYPKVKARRHTTQQGRRYIVMGETVRIWSAELRQFLAFKGSTFEIPVIRKENDDDENQNQIEQLPAFKPLPSVNMLMLVRFGVDYEYWFDGNEGILQDADAINHGCSHLKIEPTGDGVIFSTKEDWMSFKTTLNGEHGTRVEFLESDEPGLPQGTYNVDMLLSLFRALKPETRIFFEMGHDKPLHISFDLSDLPRLKPDFKRMSYAEDYKNGEEYTVSMCDYWLAPRVTR